MSKSKIIRIGNSLGITIPSKIIKSLSLKVGDEVEVGRPTPDVVTIKFMEVKQLFMDLPNIKTTIKNPL